METVAAEPAVIAPAHCKADDILIIARQEFARLGYRGVTVRGIADKAQVSTRTLYNHFTDKLGLFRACIEAGAANFPRPDLRLGAKPFDVLSDFATALLRYLTSKGSMQLSLIVFRDGNAFPEIREAARDNHERHVVRPIAEFLLTHGADVHEVSRLARLFSNMITSEWQRRILFGESIMDENEISEHVEQAAKVFLNGVEIDYTV